jgi:hypothetical protein
MEVLFHQAFSNVLKKISRGLFQTIKGALETEDLVSISSVEPSWLMDVNGFCDRNTTMYECGGDVTLD